MEKMHSDDADFELSVSNSIKRMKLYHKSSSYKQKFDNVVTHSIGLVFVNSHVQGQNIRQGTEELNMSLKDEISMMNLLFDCLHIGERRVIQDQPMYTVEEVFN